MNSTNSKATSSIPAAVWFFLIGIVGFGACCVLLSYGLSAESVSAAIPYLLAAVFVGVITAFAIGLIDREQAVIRHERTLQAEADYERMVAPQRPALPAPQQGVTTNFSAPIGRPPALLQTGADQWKSIEPDDEERIIELAKAIALRCRDRNPSQVNIEGRIPLRADGLLRSHSDITAAMLKLAALGWVGKSSNSKTGRWLWRDRQGGNQLIDYDRTDPPLS